MGINYEYYKVFYYVAKYGNITMAAKSLFLSQSTVSRIIINLEHDLDTHLFLRNKKGVILTDTGMALYHHVSQACEHIFVGEQRVSLLKHMEEGFIRIGTTEMIMKYYLMPVLSRFRKEYPSIRMDISFQDPMRVGDALKSGLLDLAVLASPLQTDSEIEVREWKKFEDVLIAGNDFRDLKDKVVSLQQLTEYPFVSMRGGMSARTYLDNIFWDYGVELKPSYEAESMPLILNMIQENFGIGCVAECYVQEAAERGDIFRVQLEQPLPLRKICVLTGREVPGSIVRETFLKQMLK